MKSIAIGLRQRLVLFRESVTPGRRTIDNKANALSLALGDDLVTWRLLWTLGVLESELEELIRPRIDRRLAGSDHIAVMLAGSLVQSQISCNYSNQLYGIVGWMLENESPTEPYSMVTTRYDRRSDCPRVPNTIRDLIRLSECEAAGTKPFKEHRCPWALTRIAVRCGLERQENLTPYTIWQEWMTSRRVVSETVAGLAVNDVF